MATCTGSNQPLTVVSALRAIVAAANADAGGDKAYSEIPCDLICDGRRALAMFDVEYPSKSVLLGAP